MLFLSFLTKAYTYTDSSLLHNTKNREKKNAEIPIIDKLEHENRLLKESMSMVKKETDKLVSEYDALKAEDGKLKDQIVIIFFIVLYVYILS